MLALRVMLWLHYVLPGPLHSRSQCALFCHSRTISVFMCAFHCVLWFTTAVSTASSRAAFGWIKDGVESKMVQSLVECWQAAMTHTHACALPGFEMQVFHEMSHVVGQIRFVIWGTTVLQNTHSVYLMSWSKGLFSPGIELVIFWRNGNSIRSNKENQFLFWQFTKNWQRKGINHDLFVFSGAN